jgi:hypothetical protein
MIIDPAGSRASAAPVRLSVQSPDGSLHSFQLYKPSAILGGNQTPNVAPGPGDSFGGPFMARQREFAQIMLPNRCWTVCELGRFPLAPGSHRIRWPMEMAHMTRLTAHYFKLHLSQLIPAPT